MTPQQEQAIRELLAKITLPPWTWEWIADKSNEWAVGQAWDESGKPIAGRLPESEWLEDTVIERRLVGLNESGHAKAADAEFIASAPQFVAGLLDELAALRSELQRLKIAISPRHGESWSVNQLVTLADAHREDSETIDRYELPTSDAYATSYDYDAAALERRVALQRMTEERDEWRHAYYDLAKEYGRG